MITPKAYFLQRMKELKSTPGYHKLAVIQVGNNAASNAYINGKAKDCEALGIDFLHIKHDAITEQELINEISKLNNDKSVTGIIVQLPLPKEINVSNIQLAISPDKDVDGFHPLSKYTPCTPKGIMDWLDYNDYDLRGKDVVIAGRSEIVGKPLVNLMIDKGATVTCLNSKSQDTYFYTKHADLFIIAVGKPEAYVWWDVSYDKCDIVIDVGINRINGHLVGDFLKDTDETQYYVTPVPGGVGLLTRLALMENVLS